MGLTRGRRFRSGGLDDAGTVGACGCDPLEGLAWTAGSWRGQDPYTTFAFFRAAPGQAVDAEQLALLYGADPSQVAAGKRPTSAKAMYTFDYMRDDHRVDDGWGAPDHPELTDTFELYFHALEESLGLRLPRRDFAEGEVRAAYWAG
ncbi:hypothetical protein ACIGFK_19710 [Streptomyces sp. NPDC085524]|uniref:hypothetical protein n=1 Tax=unclassified Streptomyces TaxID=2593676 RepID=UPI0036846696